MNGKNDEEFAEWLRTEYAVVHTWMDMDKSARFRRPVWRSSVKIYFDENIAYKMMKQEFLKYLEDNKESVCCADFYYNSAYIEYAEGCKEIWSITTDHENATVMK